jgi:hypothetical protein
MMLMMCPLGLLNYKWYNTGLTHPIDKLVAALTAALYIGAGTSYWKSGDKPSFGILSVAGALQAACLKVATP